MPPDRSTAQRPPSPDDGKRRILALSGGGVRGIIEVAFLEAVEAAYRARHGAATRLCDIFDLVGGASTGAVIATAVALGQPMSEIRDYYLERAHRLFSRKRWWNLGWAPIFDCEGLEAEFRRDVGDIALGDAALQTYLAILIKRLDTGAPWIVSNISGGPYFEDPADGSYRGNRHYRLARLLRASTAAPMLFSQELIEMHPDGAQGVFVDGGLSPYNDPSLALLQLARMRAFGLDWPLGPEKLFVLSVGAGRKRVRFDPARAARMGPLGLLLSAMRGVLADADQHTLKMMEWMGRSTAPSYIDSEVGELGDEFLTGEPLFDYLRLDLPLDAGSPLGLSQAEVRRLARMDHPSAIRPLYDLARAYCAETWDMPVLLG